MLTTVFTSLTLIAATLMGVESAREEAAPVEQYNDSGETIRQADGLLVPTSVALKNLLHGGSLAVEESRGDSSEAAAKRASPSWTQLYGGYGKREQDWDFTEPEYYWNRILGLGDKRSPKWNDLNGMWGKRSEKQWNSLRGGWGKRGWNDMSHGYGKRQSPHWNNLRGMWG